MFEDVKKVKKASMMINSLCIFTKLKEDKVIKNYKELLEYLSKEEISINVAISVYNNFVYELLDNSQGTSLKKYIIDKIFLDNNPFTTMIDNEDLSNKIVINQMVYELKALEYACSIDNRYIKDVIVSKSKALQFEKEIVDNLMCWDVITEYENICEKAIDKLKFNILKSNDWSQRLEDIIEFYRHYGTGEFGEYRAFVWEYEDDKQYLRAVKNPDCVKLKDLVGYENQKETIIDNTKQFLNGHAANNLLLYGSRGTGKSSTVKAIINEFYNEGLRLIEVDKERLVDFTKIIRILKNKNLKFIIFVDDLVFEEGEASYSALKTILEGGIEDRSNNILIYATTNRKHLVKETFSERSGDDVHAQDSIEEKLSLSDRFGITVSFYSPDQKEYLKIIDGIVEARGLKADIEYIHAEALKWVRWNNARSPRTAKQFMNWFEGNLKKDI